MAGLKFGMKLTNRIAKAQEQLRTKSKSNLQGATMEWHGGIIETLTGNRSGRQYNIPGTQRTYTASAPGEAPASRTGVTRSSYRFRVVGTAARPVGEVGSPYDHALFLEKGTRKMEPRPHVHPAYEARKAQILAKLKRRWDK